MKLSPVANDRAAQIEHQKQAWLRTFAAKNNMTVEEYAESIRQKRKAYFAEREARREERNAKINVLNKKAYRRRKAKELGVTCAEIILQIQKKHDNGAGISVPEGLSGNDYAREYARQKLYLKRRDKIGVSYEEYRDALEAKRLARMKG